MAEETKETKDVKTEEKEEAKTEEKEKVEEKTTETKEETYKSEEPEEKGGFSKEKLYGVGMVVAGIVIFAALAIWYPGFWDLFIKGIVLGVAVAAIGLVVLGIVFGLYA